MVGFLFFFFGLLTMLGMSGMAAYTDFRGFKIPNIIPLTIVGAFVCAYGVVTLTEQRDIVFTGIMGHVAAAGIVLVVTGGLFVLKQLGAGDSKFATAIALWAGMQGLVPFLFYMALAGGLIAAFSLVLRKKKLFANAPEGSWINKAQNGAGVVPYGMAIAAGALAMVLFKGYFNPALWEKMF
ncbi:MAG: prepilin peptidase [Pseudobdellovibrionaceae bacterium]